ncbi:MAG: ribosome-associated translation inhibitor RaiA [Desulfovermiculus sp.]|nr:ribosome-associated translation inhibitor RaiA [Desulfovermiculus sp.]
MDVVFNFKNFEASNHLKQYAQTRFEKLDKYMRNPETATVQVNLEVEKFRQVAEVILTADENKVSAQEETEDMYSTIDMVLDKVEAQLRKLRDKQKDRRRGKGNRSSAPIEPGATFLSEQSSEDEQPRIVPTEMYEPKPMDDEEAAIRLQKSDNDFLVFFNAGTNRVNVIYRLKNGDFGLIDPRV